MAIETMTDDEIQQRLGPSHGGGFWSLASVARFREIQRDIDAGEYRPDRSQWSEEGLAALDAIQAIADEATDADLDEPLHDDCEWCGTSYPDDSIEPVRPSPRNVDDNDPYWPGGVPCGDPACQRGCNDPEPARPSLEREGESEGVEHQPWCEVFHPDAEPCAATYAEMDARRERLNRIDQDAEEDRTRGVRNEQRRANIDWAVITASRASHDETTEQIARRIGIDVPTLPAEVSGPFGDGSVAKSTSEAGDVYYIGRRDGQIVYEPYEEPTHPHKPVTGKPGQNMVSRLYQSRVWTTAAGEVIPICELETPHALSVAGYLRRYARRLYRMDPTPKGGQSIVPWLLSLPLWNELEAELRFRGVFGQGLDDWGLLSHLRSTGGLTKWERREQQEEAAA